MPTLQETIEPAMRIKRITVLISGSGSNLQALLDASLTPFLPNAQVTYVLSSRSNAFGLQRAARNNPPVPTSVCALKTFLNHNPGATRENYDAEVARRVLESRPDIVVLAGWMHILSDAFLDILNGTKPPPAAPALPPPTNQDIADAAAAHATAADLLPVKELPPPPPTQTFPIPCINLHPALPGKFDGANAIGRAYEAFKKGETTGTGVMVHRVIKEVDAGEPLVVREVPIKEGDTLEQVEERIHKVEHEIIVEGTRKVLDEAAKTELEASKPSAGDDVESARKALENVRLQEEKLKLQDEARKSLEAAAEP